MDKSLEEFILTSGKVVITDRVANINRVMRRINRYDGVDLTDCRVMSVSQIAKELVSAYASVYEPDKRYRFISPSMSAMIMQVIVKTKTLKSVPEESKCMGTAEEILRSLNRIRLNEPTDYYHNDKDEKLLEMKELLRIYEEKLRKNNELDYPMLINKAISVLDHIKEGEDTKEKMECLLPWVKSDIGIVKDIKLTGQEEKFLNALEKTLEKGFTRNLIISGNDKTSYHFFRSYGIDGEVKYVADTIKEKNIPLGDALIIYASDSYENMLRGQLDIAGIDYTFAKGYHVSSEDYITFMLDLIAFINDDYSYESLHKVIKNPVTRIKGGMSSYLKILNEGIGWGRSRYEDFISRCDSKLKDTPFVCFLTDILKTFDEKNSTEQIFKGLVEISKAYTYKADKIRIALSADLKGQARVFSVISSDEAFNAKLTYITDYLKELHLSQSDAPDAIAIYPYGVSLTTDRNYIFVLGLSNENVSGTKAESPVFSDAELERYASGQLDLAKDRNQVHKNRFINTLDTFFGKDIYVGYSEYDTVKLLDNSKSLIYNDLLIKAGLTDDDIIKTGYSLIEGKVKLSKEAFYDAYKDAEEDTSDEDESDLSPMHLSASSLQTLLRCPFSFYYKKVRNIPDIEYTKRMPDRWLMANQKGNLFHRTMEDYVNKAIIEDDKKATDKDLLEKIYAEYIKLFLKEQPAPSEHIFEDERNEYFEVILGYANALHDYLNSSDKPRKVIGCEVDFKDIPYSGGTIHLNEKGEISLDSRYDICFSGQADRVDGYVEDGTLYIEIIDYKTGKVENKAAEIEAGLQIQHYVYAICIKKWANDNIKTLEDRFGTKINEVKISSVDYVFPFEEDNNIIPVSDPIRDDDLKLSENTDATLQMVVGNIQHGMTDKAIDFMKYYTDERIDKTDGGIDKFCQYCNYKNICRMRL